VTGPSDWRLWFAALVFTVDVAASLHAILRKRDVRSAIAWTGLIWLVPGFGAMLYAALGVNRVRRRALHLHRDRRRIASSTAEHIAPAASASPGHPNLRGLAHLAERLSGRPLLAGNSVAPLVNGDAAYPAMLEAIDGAAHAIALSTYIFADDESGRRFVDALTRALQRGVEVRVLIDGVGVRYTVPPVHTALRRAGVPTALFLPTVAQAGLAFFQLRNHRKVLLVDGRVAFTGGMNIQHRNVVADAPRRAIRDVHFRVEGPVVRQLQDAFGEDWAFTTGEMLDAPRWYPGVARRGTTAARVITDGPDGDLEVTRNVLLGAIATARESLRIVTPYFLPDAPTVAALGVAAMRGVQVDIVLPARGNIPLAQWASAAMLWQVLRPGCRVFLTPPPFDHAKLFVVDRAWALVGSTNWDPRSLRLNFELDLECHDDQLAASLDAIIDARIAEARPFTLDDADRRAFHVRVRDGLARLLSPYL
jgi:cardiolipin synthase